MGWQWPHPDASPIDTAMVHLIGYSSDPLSDDFDFIAGLVREHDQVAEIVSAFYPVLSRDGFSSIGLYLRGGDESYRVCPSIASVFLVTLEPEASRNSASWAPVSQFAFVDRESAEGYLARLIAETGLERLTVRELPLNVPLIAAV